MVAWHTYTVDGRALEIDRSNGVWTALCEGRRARASSAAAAIRGALGEETASLGASAALEHWIEEQATRLEDEAGPSAP